MLRESGTKDSRKCTLLHVAFLFKVPASKQLHAEGKERKLAASEVDTEVKNLK